MRKILFLLVLIIISASFLSAAENTAFVKSVKGNVKYKTGSTWTSVTEGMKVPSGAVISTGFKSEAVLDLGSSEIFIKPLTRMSITELTEKNKTVNTDLNLRLGRIKADVKTSKGLKHDFTIKTPVSTAAVRGTKFTFDGVNINVDNGNVVVSNKRKQSASYKGGEKGVCTGNNPPEGGAAGRQKDLAVSADTSDILSGSDDPFTGSRSFSASSGVEYGSIKINWTYQDQAPVLD